MAIKLHPDARERVTVYLRSDDALADANDADVLDRYERTGDESGLVVTADVVRFTIHPLTASTLSLAQREAGDLPFDAVQVSRRVERRLKETLAADPSAIEEEVRGRLMVEEGLTAEHWGPLQAWSEARALAMCSLALVEADVFPGVAPQRVGGVDRYPVATLERLPMACRNDLAAHVDRITTAGAEGKASPASRYGAREPG